MAGWANDIPTKKPWKYKAAAEEFRKHHGMAAYTIDFNPTLEAERADPNLRMQQRIWSCIKRQAWGNLSDVCVDAMPKVESNDPTPRPLTQADIARLCSADPGLAGVNSKSKHEFRELFQG
jgi:hypothetical protein